MIKEVSIHFEDHKSKDINELKKKELNQLKWPNKVC